jgi:hypothetical protein
LPENGTELYQGIQKPIDYDNNKKSHQGIERLVPAALYKQAA